MKNRDAVKVVEVHTKVNIFEIFKNVRRNGDNRGQCRPRQRLVLGSAFNQRDWGAIDEVGLLYITHGEWVIADPIVLSSGRHVQRGKQMFLQCPVWPQH